MDKVVNLLKAKDAVIPRILLNNYKKLKLSEVELVILIFLINSREYNPKSIADFMDIKLPLLLEMISQLEEKGIIITGNFNKLKMDRTKWYTIDYEKLDNLIDNLNLPSGQNDLIIRSK